MRHDEDFTGFSHPLNPLCQMDRDAGHIPSSLLDLTGVHAGPNLKAQLTDGVPDRNCTSNRAGGTVERGEDTVAAVLFTRCPPNPARAADQPPDRASRGGPSRPGPRKRRPVGSS